jgi:hypothetical protein
MQYEVTVVVGKRQTYFVEAADEAEARDKCERGDEPLKIDYVHEDDEVFVVQEPVLAELGPGDPAAKGLTEVMQRPGEDAADAYGRVFGDVVEGEEGDPEGPT